MFSSERRFKQFAGFRFLQRSLLIFSVVVLYLACFAGPLVAHDFWIEPSDFAPHEGRKVAIDLRVGERFEGQSVARNPSGFVRFESLDVLGQSEARPIAGVPGVSPAGFLEASGGPASLVVYEGTPRLHRMKSATFEKYLGEEGLEHVAALREQFEEVNELGRESYSRCAKAFVGPVGEASTQEVGLTLELFAERDPADLAQGDDLPVRLHYKGQPVSGVLVQALAKHSPDYSFRARTDAAGRVQVPLSVPGPWLVKAVHMERMTPQEQDASGSDWRSWWASLTFRGPEK